MTLASRGQLADKGLPSRCALQISDASKGLTFATRPRPTNYEALSKSPLTKSDEYGDTRNTTWGSENGAAPAFNNAYARTLLERDYVSDVLSPAKLPAHDNRAFSCQIPALAVALHLPAAEGAAKPLHTCQRSEQMLTQHFAALVQYHVFYPRNGSPLDDPSANIHLTVCGRGTYNADDDVPSSGGPPTSGGGRRLLRSKHNW